MKNPATLNESQKKAVATAHQVIRDIDFLAANPQFKRFAERFQNQLDSMADKILHGTMTDREREDLRQKRLGILEVFGSLKDDRSAQMRVLSSYGFKAGTEMNPEMED